METVSGPKELPPVAVAMVNWNGWQDTINCLESLGRLRYPDPALVICDNASTDNSVEHISRWAQHHGWPWKAVEEAGQSIEPLNGGQRQWRLLIVRSTQNLGFAGGTNVAIRHALNTDKNCSFVWVLNTDTIVDPDSLHRSVQALVAHPQAGSAQSLLLSAHQPDLLDSAGLRLIFRGGAKDILHRRPRSEFDKRIRGRRVVEIFGCCGAAALYRVSALQGVGLFDESLFVGYEDVDLACRLRKYDLPAILVPDSVVHHIGGISRDRKKRGLRWWTTHRNKLRLVARWYPTLLAIPILLFGVVRALIAAIRSNEVPIALSAQLIRTLWRDWRGGQEESVRRRILRIATRDYVA